MSISSLTFGWNLLLFLAAKNDTEFLDGNSCRVIELHYVVFVFQAYLLLSCIVGHVLQSKICLGEKGQPGYNILALTRYYL